MHEAMSAADVKLAPATQLPHEASLDVVPLTLTCWPGTQAVLMEEHGPLPAVDL